VSCSDRAGKVATALGMDVVCSKMADAWAKRVSPFSIFRNSRKKISTQEK
jgi:hypothetical protein